ncbi:MAG: hypothetical protein OHK006_23760 [Thermodesulfovibrionales bacterium]
MRSTIIAAALLCVCIAAVSGPAFADNAQPLTVNHDLNVMLIPSSTFLSVEDTVTLPEPGNGFSVKLHADLTLTSLSPGVEITKQGTLQGPVPVSTYLVKAPEDIRTFTVSYQGQIVHPIRPVGQEQARGFSSTPGIISPDGVYLAGSSYWYPSLDNRMVGFRMNVSLPSDWSAVSQGSRTSGARDESHARVTWESGEPQDEIFLIAGRFHEYAREGTITSMVFLRTPDPALAGKYLDATDAYISLYDSLIGPYPYRKFALVENFWETGFGMPSFTLLGPKVIRLPFIISSSYPHEILHNWWGNSVFPDYESGNWAEGLTAYLADHLIREQEGSAAEYRFTTLQKYADYVLSNRDFPLTAFTSRRSTAEEAIGYGKSLMFFHMLRQQLGDRAFAEGLRHFYRENRFRFASFSDLRNSFEAVSGTDLSQYFKQWTGTEGAPELRLSSAQASADQDGYTLSLQFEQTQKGDAYRLRIPVAITLEGGQAAYQTVIEMDVKKLLYRIHLPVRPLRVDADPEFDIFRRLDRQEIPPAVTQALGSHTMLVILPSNAEPVMYEKYLDLARALGSAGPESLGIYVDREVGSLPRDRTVVVLGGENLFFEKAMKSLAGLPVSRTDTGFRIDDQDIPDEDHAIVLAGRNPGNADMALMVITADKPEIIDSLARKLPHYHTYSYLAFRGQKAENVLKGRWQASSSPLTAFLAGPDGQMPDVSRAGLAPRKALSETASAASADKLKETVATLTSVDMEGRGLNTTGIDRAAAFLAEKFREADLQPHGPAGSYLQEWTETIAGLDRPAVLKNVIGMAPGSDPVLAKECVIVGAHYDGLGMGWPESQTREQGEVHPGADDNASGVSLLLDIGRAFSDRGNRTGRTLVFAAFTAEESGKRGSRHFVDQIGTFCPRGVFAMLNLDTVGRLSAGRLFAIGGHSSKAWPSVLKEAADASGLAVDLVKEDLDSSDQTSFHEAGIPAVQFFTGPHQDYHRPTDTGEKLNLPGMRKIASFVRTLVSVLGSRTEPLPYAAPETPVQTRLKMERKSGLGIVPDFGFQGKGCRLAGVLPDSPAAAAGLKEGDVVTALNSIEITGIKDLSSALTSFEPGQHVTIRFLRGGKEMTAEAEALQR